MSIKNEDLTPVVRSLLDELTAAGLQLKEIECDGEYHSPAPRLQEDVIKLILEAQCSDLGFSNTSNPVEKNWLRIIQGNDPEALVNDYSCTPILESVIPKWSDSWEDCVWVPQRKVATG